jgi:type II secretory pathway component PulK
VTWLTIQGQREAAMSKRFSDPSNGSILLLVLVVVAVLSLSAAASLELMHNEYRAAVGRGRQSQARALAASGVEFLKVYLAQDKADLELAGGLYDNPSELRAVLVDDQPADADRGRFTVLSPSLVDGLVVGVRYGLEDESGRLNLNALLADPQTERPRQRLLALPGMTDEIADAILDWIDDDDTSRDYGAESDVYRALDPPYECGNGPLADLDELLLVRGVTPELLYGMDRNRNFTIETDEPARGALVQMENVDGVFDRGWAAYLTVASAEAITNPEGEPRIDLSAGDLKELHGRLSTALGAEQANFIILRRQFGAATPDNANRRGGRPARGSSTSGSTGATVSASQIEIDFEQEASQPIGSLLDLVGVEVEVPGKDGAQPQRVLSPWKDSAGGYDQLLPLYDYVAVSAVKAVAGRINVNTASRTVLSTLPDIELSTVEQILARRDPTSNAGGIGTTAALNSQRHAVWLLASGVVTLEEMKKWEPYVTAGGAIYRCQVAGFFDDHPTIARLELLVERMGSSPRIVGLRDLTPWGPGFDPVTLGAEPLGNP